MQISHPKGILAGFHFQKPEPAVAELIFCGEYWAMPEWFVGEHDHKVWELYFQLDGVSEWAGPNQNYRLRPGSFLAVAPNVRHRMSKPARQKHHFIYAAIDLAAIFSRHPSLRELWRGHTLVYRPNVESVAAPFRQLVREVTLAQAHRPTGLRLALDALVLEATRSMTVAGGRSFVGAHPAVVRVKELLEHQCQRSWRLADLAQVAGLSPTHLAELFARDVGLPPRQYLLQVRIDRAKQYLQQKTIPITTLAMELGFSSSQHFAAVFKRRTGTTPRTYAQRRNS